MPHEPITLHRDTLYAEVWAEPVRTVARRKLGASVPRGDCCGTLRLSTATCWRCARFSSVSDARDTKNVRSKLSNHMPIHRQRLLRAMNGRSADGRARCDGVFGKHR